MTKKRRNDTSSFLTERQIFVLRMRSKDLSQQEVSEILGTTRSNVSILEKRAHQNVERAKNTLRQWTMIQAPVSVTVPEGTDVFEVPGRVFQEADRKGVRLSLNSLDLIVRLRSEAPQVLKKRVVLRDLEIFVTENGEVLVQDAP